MNGKHSCIAFLSLLTSSSLCNSLIDKWAIFNASNSTNGWAELALRRSLGQWVVHHLFRIPNWCTIFFDILGMDKVGKLTWADNVEYYVSDEAALHTQQQEVIRQAAEHLHRAALAPLEAAVKVTAEQLQQQQEIVDAHIAAGKPGADTLAGITQGILPMEVKKQVDKNTAEEKKTKLAQLARLKKDAEALEEELDVEADVTKNPIVLDAKKALEKQKKNGRGSMTG
ncbi:hypothetical protein B0H14DRAFT_2592409 [Mycena olivaceomarginata]|nr:hypothetical protein B0H14DRAFT_2592409 [Mycena olivaceomarginata]